MSRSPNEIAARRRWIGVSLASAALLSAGAPPTAAQGTSLGPLRTSEQNPLYRFFYVPEAESADVVGDGRLRIDFSTSYSNIFERSESDVHDQLFDLEQMTNSVTLRYGPSPSLEVGGRVGFHTGWGGFLDPFVSGFHNMFGFPNGGRENEPNGQHRFHLERDEPRLRFDLASRTLDPEDVRLFGKWRFLGSTTAPGALSLRATLRRSGGPMEAGRLAGAFALLGRITGEEAHLHLGAGATTLNPPASLEPVASTSAIFFTLAVEGRIRPGLSMVGQLAASSRYVGGGFRAGELDRFPTTLVIGFSGRTESEWTWEVSFAEDFPPDSPSVDFTVDLQLGRVL